MQKLEVRKKEAEKIGLKLVGEYLGVMKKTAYLCSVHGEIMQTPNKVQQGLGCQLCGRQKQFNSRRKDLEVIKIEAMKSGLEYVKGFVNYRKKALYKCKIHGEFEAHPSSIKSGSRCGYCVGRHKTKQSFISDAEKVNLIYCGDFKLTHLKHKYICKTHGEIFMTPDNVRVGKGCASCNKKGFDPTLPAVFYVVDIELETGLKVIGYGITTDKNTRYNRHKVNFKKVNAKHSFIKEIEMIGHEAVDLERKVKKVFFNNHFNTAIHGFINEAIVNVSINDFLKEIL
jgi:hypothetical protein